MSRLIMMCGIPGSGKSTWIQNCKGFIGNDVVVVSRDAIRFSMLKEGEDYFGITSLEDVLFNAPVEVVLHCTVLQRFIGFNIIV